MKINILTCNNFISHYFLYPLLVNEKRLKEMNIYIKYYKDINDSIYDCDVILLDSKHFSAIYRGKEDVLSLLQIIREKCNKVIWMDLTASTGTTHFQVMPFVDRYWKKQLLKDLSLYENKFYGERIYTDYYKHYLNIDNESTYTVEPLKEDVKCKVDLSWNLGLGPHSTNIRISNLMRLTPWNIRKKFNFKYKLKSYLPSNERAYSICFRGTMKYSKQALSFQRIKIIEKLKLRGIETEPFSYRKYLKEIKESLIAVSPFGYGEICYRDFEIILAGALLFKPSMEHLKTYPDIYVKNKTYVPFEWDFSDFDEKLDILLNDRNLIHRIIHEVHEKYIQSTSNDGQEGFCNRFKDILLN